MTGIDPSHPGDGCVWKPRSLAESRQLLRDGKGGFLDDRDLLALVIGPARGRVSHQLALQVLEDGGGWYALGHETCAAPWWETLSESQAVRLAATLELARRLNPDGGPVPHLRTPREVFEATADLRTRRREHFVGLYLNTRNRLLVRETISVGSLNAAVVHPREVYAPALRQAAAGLIVVHNHPSGETDPSDDDLAITRRLAEAGELLGIALLDHVIVGTGGFTSLKETGFL